MGDNKADATRRRMLSIESSGLSIDEFQSIQSISSLSESSLELPPQAGSVQIRTATTRRTRAQGVPSTAFYVGAADDDEDGVSKNSSHFSLGLEPSEGWKRAHWDREISQDRSSSSTTFEAKRSTSLESSDQEDDGSESLMDDHMEIAALIAKAKREINQDHVTPQNDIKQSDSLLNKSSAHQKIPTNPKTVSPSPDKGGMAKPLEIATLIATAKREINQDNETPQNDSKQFTGSLLDRSSAHQKIPTPSPDKSIVDKPLEVAALIATAKREINQEHEKLQNDSSGSLLASSSAHKKIPTTPNKSREVKPLETEQIKSGATSIQGQSIKAAQRQDHVLKKEATTKPDLEETGVKQSHYQTPLRRLMRDSSLSDPSSFQKEKQPFEKQQEDRQHFGSHRNSHRKSDQPILLEPDRQSSATKGERKQNLAGDTEEHPQSHESLRENGQMIAHEKEGAHRYSSVARERKSKNVQNYLQRAPFSRNKKDPMKGTKHLVDTREDWREKLLRQVNSQPKKKPQQRIHDRQSWEGYRSSKLRREAQDGARRHTWDYEKTDEQPWSMSAAIRGYTAKVTSVETNDVPPSQHGKLSAFKTNEKSNNHMLSHEEKRGDFSRKESRSTQTETQGNNDFTEKRNEVMLLQTENKGDFSLQESRSTRAERQGTNDSTMYKSKVDCRTISEKLNDNFYSERQDKSASRISYPARQPERQAAPENESEEVFRREYPLESRQDSFDGERLLYVDHNRRSEMSSVTFKCRALSEKERLLRVYQEKEKVADEFITKWSELSETTRRHTRQNDHHGYKSHNEYASKPWLTGRTNEMSPWCRISSLTHDYPRTTTMPMQSKALPNLSGRQVGSKKKRWVCDICGVANFESYAACFIHEKNCTGPVRNTTIDYPPQQRSWQLNE